MKDYYRILGVPSSASQEQIKSAFRELIRKHHPDKNASPEATERARDIIEAYKILTDREAKVRYDRVYADHFGSTETQGEQDSKQSKKSERSTHEDPILQKWIRAAQRQARTELDNLMRDFPEAVGVAAKGAFQYVGYYILFSIVLYILLRALISR